MLPVIAWKVYCSDGSIYTHAPEAIPQDVQVIIFYHGNGYRTLDYGNDEYIINGITLYGRLIDDQEFNNLLNEALLDTAAPQ